MSASRLSVVVLLLLAGAHLGRAAIKIDQAALTIEEADGNALESITLKSKESVKAPLTLDHTQKFKVAFNVRNAQGEAFQPEQAFLRLTSAASGRQAFFPAIQRADTLEVVASSAGVEEQMGTHGGEFQADLLIGNVSPAAALAWPLATLSVQHRPAPDGNQPPAPKTRLQELTTPKPAIVHAFRAPEKRAPSIVSLAFTGLAFAPLAAFVIVSQAAGANWRSFPQSGVARVYALTFHAGVAAILALYGAFWLGLDLMHTFPIAVVLEVVTLMAGARYAAAKGAEDDTAAAAAKTAALKQD